MLFVNLWFLAQGWQSEAAQAPEMKTNGKWKLTDGTHRGKWVRIRTGQMKTWHLSLSFVQTSSQGDWLRLGRINSNGVVGRRHIPLIMCFHSLLCPLPFLSISPTRTLSVFVTVFQSHSLFLGPSLLSLTPSLRPSPFVKQGPCSNQVLLSSSRRLVPTHPVCRFVMAIRLNFINLKG